MRASRIISEPGPVEKIRIWDRTRKRKQREQERMWRNKRQIYCHGTTAYALWRSEEWRCSKCGQKVKVAA